MNHIGCLRWHISMWPLKIIKSPHSRWCTHISSLIEVVCASSVLVPSRCLVLVLLLLLHASLTHLRVPSVARYSIVVLSTSLSTILIVPVPLLIVVVVLSHSTSIHRIIWPTNSTHVLVVVVTSKPQNQAEDINEVTQVHSLQ